MKMRMFFIVFLLSVFFSFPLFAQVHKNQDVKWEIKLSDFNDDSTEFTLKSYFSSTGRSVFLPITHIENTIPISLSKYEYPPSLIGKVNVLDFYLYEIEESQFVIENNHGDYETISFNTIMPRTRNVVTYHQLGFDSSLSYLFFWLSSKKSGLMKEPLSLYQLKLRKGSEEIRLHYLCKIADGESFIVSSNWIMLPANMK